MTEENLEDLLKSAVQGEALNWKEKGNEFARQGQYPEAVQCYSKAIKIDPNYSDAWNNLGLVLIKLGKIDEAKRVNDRLQQLKLRKSSLEPTSTTPIESKQVKQSEPVKSKACPNCHLELKNQEAESCPRCGYQLKDPFDKEITSPFTAFCYNCRTPLLNEKSICPNCGFFMRDNQAPIPTELPQKMETQISYQSNYVLLILFFLMFGAAIIHIVFGLIFLFFLSLAVYSDALKIGAGRLVKKEGFASDTWSPLSWGVSVFLIAIFFFPFYLYKRRRLFEINKIGV